MIMNSQFRSEMGDNRQVSILNITPVLREHSGRDMGCHCAREARLVYARKSWPTVSGLLFRSILGSEVAVIVGLLFTAWKRYGSFGLYFVLFGTATFYRRRQHGVPPVKRDYRLCIARLTDTLTHSTMKMDASLFVSSLQFSTIARYYCYPIASMNYG